MWLKTGKKAVRLSGPGLHFVHENLPESRLDWAHWTVLGFGKPKNRTIGLRREPAVEKIRTHLQQETNLKLSLRNGEKKAAFMGIGTTLFFNM